MDFAGPQLEADVVKRAHAGEGLADPLDTEEGSAV
jgi:hypothetical protein